MSGTKEINKSQLDLVQLSNNQAAWGASLWQEGLPRNKASSNTCKWKAFPCYKAATEIFTGQGKATYLILHSSNKVILL